jgi:hypothetical protein
MRRRRRQVHAGGATGVAVSRPPGTSFVTLHIRIRSIAMSQHHHAASITRRAAIAGLGAGGLGLAASRLGASAQNASPEAMANHPMVGAWLGITPDGPSPAFFLADGSFISSSSPIRAGADGAITYSSPQNGAWEPDPANERGIHFTSVQNVHDTSGTFMGTVTVDGYPVASEDGQSFYDDAKRARLTFRDASNKVTMVLGEDGSLPPIFGNRMRPGAPGFPEATPVPAATPTS